MRPASVFQLPDPTRPIHPTPSYTYNLYSFLINSKLKSIVGEIQNGTPHLKGL